MIFNFGNLLRTDEQKVCVIEQSVPLEQQKEYSELANNLSKEKHSFKDSDYERFRRELSSIDYTLEQKKRILTRLSLSKQVKAYRLLEYYAEIADEQLGNWVKIALIQSRIAIESELLGEHQVYISSGMGGKDGKLRFYLLIPTSTGLALQPWQRKLFKDEFKYRMAQHNCGVERVNINRYYADAVFLVPIKCNINQIIDGVVTECNTYGSFLAPIFTITNVKEPSKDEAKRLVRKIHFMQSLAESFAMLIDKLS